MTLVFSNPAMTQVQAVARQAGLILARFIGNIQGLLLCFLFAILILVVGLRKQPYILEFF